MTWQRRPIGRRGAGCARSKPPPGPSAARVILNAQEAAVVAYVVADDDPVAVAASNRLKQCPLILTELGIMWLFI